MRRIQNILVATDTRVSQQNVIDAAAVIASANDAKMKLVEVVPQFSWMTRLLVPDHARIGELLVRDKQKKLDVLAEPLRGQGLEVETKVLSGKTSVEISREVLRDQHDLVVQIAKGANSRRKGVFGTTGTRLLRECPCTVHLVTPSQSTPTHVLACIDTSTGYAEDAELNTEILQLAQTIADQNDATLSLVHAWTIDSEQLFAGVMPRGEFEQMKRDREKQVRRLLNDFLQQYGFSTNDKHVSMLKGNPTEVIPAFINQNRVSLVVMGTVGRSGAAGMLIGNTAEQILSSIDCSVVAVKPLDFISPIKIGEYVAIERQPA